MNPRLPLLGLVLVCAAQWAVPAYLVHRGQTTLTQGTQYRFRTAPVDPVDPFRGRYVVLDFEAARMTARPGSEAVEAGQRVYAPIVVGADGFASFGVLTRTTPTGSDYLEVEVQWVNGGEFGLRLPFDRYYMDERQAPEAERRYWDANRGRAVADGGASPPPTYVSVRVRNGYAVLEELYIDGTPVRELLRASSP